MVVLEVILLFKILIDPSVVKVFPILFILYGKYLFYCIIYFVFLLI